jgi:hypothetical protein
MVIKTLDLPVLVGVYKRLSKILFHQKVKELKTK